MSPQLRSLLNREWHERKSSFAIGTAWIVLTTIYAVVYELSHGIRAPVGTFYANCFLFSLVAPIFVAMTTALGEATQGTARFSASLPVSLKQLAAVRLCGAALVIAGPIALGALLLSTALLTGLVEEAGLREPNNYVFLIERESMSAISATAMTAQGAAIAAAAGVTLVYVLSIIGVRRRSETHVGFIGTIVAFVWFLFIALRETFDRGQMPWGDWVGALFPQSLALPASYGGEDNFTDLQLAQRVWGPLALNVVVNLLLGLWFARRYAAAQLDVHNRERSPRRWGLPAVFSRMSVRLPNRVVALLWLNVRESVPLAVAGFGVALLMILAGVLLEPHDPVAQTFREGRLDAFLSNLPHAIFIVAMLWGPVVAASIFGGDLQPRLQNFWRSRPIQLNVWFAIKFLVGLVAVVGVLDGVTIALTWNLRPVDTINRMSASYVACMPLFHAWMYSAAVLAICVLRRPVTGAFAALFAYFLLTEFLEAIRAQAFDPITVYNVLFFAEVGEQATFDLSSASYPLVYGTMAAMTIAAALLSFWTIRRSETQVA